MLTLLIRLMELTEGVEGEPLDLFSIKWIKTDGNPHSFKGEFQLITGVTMRRFQLRLLSYPKWVISHSTFKRVRPIKYQQTLLRRVFFKKLI